MFTELSRLSRSLKDFFNIFEFAQRHSCDPVYLKIEIATTSPYLSSIIKIDTGGTAQPRMTMKARYNP